MSICRVHTYSGRAFQPLDPEPSAVDIEDVAHALSLHCRFNGHTRFHYSVASHSLFVSELLEPELALWGLLHDASEAYLPDVVSPLKPFLTGFKEIEARVLQAVADRFGLTWPEPEQVKAVDLAVLAAEKEQVLTPSYGPWRPLPAPAPIVIRPLSPERVKALFLARFDSLTGKTHSGDRS